MNFEQWWDKIGSSISGICKEDARHGWDGAHENMVLAQQPTNILSFADYLSSNLESRPNMISKFKDVLPNDLFTELESFLNKIDAVVSNQREDIEMLKSNNDILLKNTNELAEQVKLLSQQLSDHRSRDMLLR